MIQPHERACKEGDPHRALQPLPSASGHGSPASFACRTHSLHQDDRCFSGEDRLTPVATTSTTAACNRHKGMHRQIRERLPNGILGWQELRDDALAQFVQRMTRVL
jgi:hypothetical protein